MKKKYLFCTKIWFYLTEIPLLFFLYVACYHNFTSENPWQFIPLILILSAVILFIGIYFFRMISLSYEMIRHHGLFSPRDSAIINKDKTLIITLKRRAYLGISLYGNDGKPPLFDGLRDEGSIDIYLFRGRAVGGKRTVKSILKYFGISDADIEAAFDTEKYSSETDDVLFTVSHIEDIREFRLKFKRTL